MTSKRQPKSPRVPYMITENALIMYELPRVGSRIHDLIKFTEKQKILNTKQPEFI